MNILGLNFSNDSAAALVRDGAVLAAGQEERFTRIKHFAGFPTRAIRFCLDVGKIDFFDLDAVAFFWNPGINSEAPTRRLSSLPRHQLEFLYSVPCNLLSSFAGNQHVESLKQILSLSSGKELVIHYVTHHMCHAATAFYASPFEEAAILTADGYGEKASTLIARGKGSDIEPLLSVDFPHSIGAFYAAFTQYLGFAPNSGEGKVMGLASYGKQGKYCEAMQNLVELTGDGYKLDLSVFEFFHDRPRRYNNRLIEIFGEERSPESKIDQRHMDIAFALQAVTERTILHLAKIARERTGLDNLCMAGGVALNCVANGRLVRESEFSNLFFYPSSGDAGTSVGAALFVWHNYLGGPRQRFVASEFLGPEYSEEHALSILRKSGAKYKKINNSERVAAEMIAEGLIIGWFQGRSELGPRALGNRSILADPRDPNMKDILNSRVKFREPFRPYAPSVLEEHCGEYFSSSTPSPYMLRAYDTLKDKIDVIPSVTHVDGSARVQTVNETSNPKYYRLIRAFCDLTKVPIVLNTSFNIRGEPIVNTIEEALKCYFTTDMDALFVGDVLVVKSMERIRKWLG